MSEWRPKRCSCGGELVYEESLGRTWVHCERCSPESRAAVKTDEGDALERVSPSESDEQKENGR